MNLDEALEQIIELGVAGARRDYDHPDEYEKLEGSLAGFEECRGKSPVELAEALINAKKRTRCARLEQAENYWWHRCFELEVEWVCNCVSAILLNQGLPVIIPPTARGVMQAAKIVGVAT